MANNAVGDSERSCWRELQVDERIPLLMIGSGDEVRNAAAKRC